MRYISLKHFGAVDVAPEARLTLKIIGTAMMLHNANTELEAQKEKAASNWDSTQMSRPSSLGVIGIQPKCQDLPRWERFVCWL